jgi:hypothetical protein
MRKIEHLQNMLERTRREFARKYCLHPDAPNECLHKIASAHSVRRAMLENFFAENGHVLQIKVTAHVDPVGLLAKPERVGVSKATTFSGFCSKHDAELFSPLERVSLRGNPLRTFRLLLLQTTCRSSLSGLAEHAGKFQK